MVDGKNFSSHPNSGESKCSSRKKGDDDMIGLEDSQSADKISIPGIDGEPIMAHELRKLVDTANAPIFGIDVNGNVNEWNYKTGEITGYSREEAFHEPLVSKFIVPRLRESVEEVLNKALKGIETSNYELEFETKSKETRYLLVNATTRRDAANKIVGGKLASHVSLSLVTFHFFKLMALFLFHF